MKGLEAFLLALLQACQQRHDEAVAMQRDAAEVQMYRDLMERAKTLLGALMAGGANSAMSQRILDQVVQLLKTATDAFKRYAGDTLADCLEDKSLSVGAAATAGARMYDALAHLLVVTHEQTIWVERGFHRSLWSRILFRPYRTVDPADFEMHLAMLESALASVAQATSRASNDLTLAHNPITYLLGSREGLMAPVAQVVVPQTYRRGPQKSASTVDGLRKTYGALLLFVEQYAQDICNSLRKREHPAAGASAYTVRDQISAAIALKQQAALSIEALRRATVIASQNIVDAA